MCAILSTTNSPSVVSPLCVSPLIVLIYGVNTTFCSGYICYTRSAHICRYVNGAIAFGDRVLCERSWVEFGIQRKIIWVLVVRFVFFFVLDWFVTWKGVIASWQRKQHIDLIKCKIVDLNTHCDRFLFTILWSNFFVFESSWVKWNRNMSLKTHTHTVLGNPNPVH